ncbi:hypothetical protein [Streptomyces sp. G-G2]|uniref:hypothetical protein n=1 Tax=Streptomyces sp. G-G2 TaxID=3046201 RepID=UPI0024B9A3A2|nr:hypothetical protein [Streptomyces sp. G-G2]MDJ0383085.1 hypothetical protein [Streptomyces sp. G-G2]
MGAATWALAVTAAPVRAALVQCALVRAAPNAAPTYQVKLLADPALILGRDGVPLERVAAALGLREPSGCEVAQYIDDARLSFAGQGWIVRFRHDDDEDRIRLTYKTRFDIEGDGTDRAAVEEALDRANAHSFDAGTCNYTPQVNLSYSRATLDFSNKKSEPAPDRPPGELPDRDASRALALERLPGKMRKWPAMPPGWAEAVTADSLVHGPVRQTNYPGEILGHRTEMQVTPIRDADGGESWFTEITAKAATFAEAVRLRADLMRILRAEGWLLERDAFKTDLILGGHRDRSCSAPR